MAVGAKAASWTGGVAGYEDAELSKASEAEFVEASEGGGRRAEGMGIKIDVERVFDPLWSSDTTRS
jgi:hypothetical protein